MASRKINFVTEMQDQIAIFAQACDALMNLSTIYTDRDYASGEADEIVDGDISTLEVTAAQVALGITFINNLDKFLNANSPTNNDYDKTINLLRNDINT